jgi:flagella synthesis protein FlgN
VPSPAEPDALAELLGRELGVLQSFLVLLRQEQALLAEGASEALTTLANEKLRVAGELGGISASRENQLLRSKLPSGRAGMDAWIASGAGTSSRRNWDELLRLAGEARSLNEANGRLIALHLQHYQQGLNVLMAAADKTATYGPDGQQRPGGVGRSLGSA